MNTPKLRIVNIYIHYVNNKAKKHTITVVPKSDSITEMKLQIAKRLDRLKTIQYYYVVMEARDKKGNSVYRTVVPKTVMV